MSIRPVFKRFSEIAVNDPIPPPAKKKQRLYENPVSLPSHPVCPPSNLVWVSSLRSVEERAREIFLMNLCFQWKSWEEDEFSKRDVFIISSSQQEIVEKELVKGIALLCFRRCVINWVDVPKDGFFKRENFVSMINAICEIPFGSTIYIQEGETLLIPKYQEKSSCKNPPSKSVFKDKVIVFDSEGSRWIQMIFKFFRASDPQVPHYYITRGSSLAPLGRLTERSVVYFSEKGQLVLQTTQALTARGFRVVGSLGKKRE